MASAEVDLDPEALRGVADELGAVGSAIQQLRDQVEPTTAATAHFGEPDTGGLLAAELAGRCDDVLITLSRVGQLASALAEDLLAGAELVAAVDEHSAQGIRAAEA